WPGTNWVKELTTAMMGLWKSPSVMPVARHRARAPAMLRPAVEVFERYSGMGASRYGLAEACVADSASRSRWLLQPSGGVERLDDSAAAQARRRAGAASAAKPGALPYA